MNMNKYKVTITFKDSTSPKTYSYDDLYIKSECLCVKLDDMVTKYPLVNIHSFSHKY